MTLKELYQTYYSIIFNSYGAYEAQAGAMLLLEGLHNVERKDYSFDKDKSVEVDSDFLEKVLEMIAAERPLQHIIGFGYFYDRKFKVSENVLIPRNETEELVYWIIKDNKENNSNIKILDIGTGSGAISITLDLEMENSTVTALDISSQALEVARSNNSSLGANVNFLEVDILNATELKGEYDIIVSNPPYITKKEKPLMRKNVLDYEPDLALFVEDDDPLLFYRKIGELAFSNLNDGGTLYYEINENYGIECCDMLKIVGFRNVILKRDLNHKNRMIKAIK